MREENINLHELLNFVKKNPNSNTKNFCNLGVPERQVAEVIAELLTIKKLDFELIVDSDGIRHTLAQHGLTKSKIEAERNQIPIVEADLLALSNWLPNTATIKAGQYKPGKQPRVEVELVLQPLNFEY